MQPAQQTSPVSRPAPLGRLRAGLGPGLIVALIAALLLADFVPLPGGFTVQQCRAALLIVFTISSWALNLFPEPLTTLLFFLLAVLFQVVPPATIFSGFSTPTWWLVFGGTVIGIAIRATTLGERLSHLLSRDAARSYNRYIALIVVMSVGLAFVMPSTLGRVMLLVPIVLALADRLGFESGRTGRTGLVLAVSFGSYMPSTAILPANVPNTVLLGAVDSIYNIKLQYGPYLLLHFPVLGILKAIVLIWAICKLFPDTVAPRTQGAGDDARLKAPEKLLIAVLLISLALYATDAWHGISPAWISLGAGLICMLPQARLVTPKALNDQVQIIPLIYVAGFLGLAAMIAQTGLGAWAGHQLLQLVDMQPGHPGGNLTILAAIGAGIGLITTLPGLPAVMTPLAREFSQASGLALYSVLMLEVPIFSTVLLPYECPPIMIGMALGAVSIRDGTRLCLLLAAITLTVLLPLDYLWWNALGYVKP
ncbi:MAG: sodium:sulfate symporter [Betaproteobacteria bacterium]|nr:sodium:sulfate symporter [Betaproteobacteria bacterium]